jgi:hypothetical protein
MKLSEHAKDKLEIYGIDGKEIIKACRSPIHMFYDAHEEAYIKIIELEEIPFVVVYNITTQTIIYNRLQDRPQNNNKKT